MGNYQGPSKLAQIAAAFCVITALLGLIFYMSGKPFAELNEAKAAVSEAKKELKNLEEEQNELRNEYAKKYAYAEEDLKRLEDALDDANDRLDEVCSESTFGRYSWYDCYDNNYSCRSLHEEVEEAKKALDDYKKDLDLEEYQEQLEIINENIRIAESKLAAAQGTYEALLPVYREAKFCCFAFISTCAAFVALGIYACLNEPNVLMGQIICGVGMMGSFFLLICHHLPVGGIFPLNPHAWSIVLFGLLFMIIRKRDNPDENVLPYHVAAVIVTTIIYGLSFQTGVYIPVAILYVVSMMMLSFALVPIYCTERISIPLHIFWSLFTCGVWTLVWIHHVTNNLNYVEDVEERSPMAETLLCLFLPLYYVYWLYKTGEYVEAYGAEHGKTFKLDLLCLIFAFVCPLMSTVLIQDKINRIVDEAEENEIIDV